MSLHATITVFRTVHQLQDASADWHRLWLRDPDATPFQRPEWLLPWWCNFSQPDLHVVCIHRQGSLAGMIPLYVYADPASGERQLLLVGAGTSDYLDGIFAPECTDDDIGAALAYIAQQTTWDVAHLTQLRPQSRLLAAVTAAAPTGLRFWPGEPTSRCAAQPVSALPKKVRAEVVYFRNAAIARGKLRMQIADQHTWQGSLDTLIHLHTARWQASGQAGVLADPAVLAWHRQAVPQLLAAGCLRLYILLLDQEPVAALYGLIDPPGRPGRTVYFYLIGYSPAHAAFKPGTLLTAMASEHAAAEGTVTIDMLRGDETYKKFWHVEEKPTQGLSFPRQP